MKDDQHKVGILFSLPVCIVTTFFVFPIGIILIFMRLYKKGKITKKVKNIGVGIGGAFIAVLVIGVLTLPEVDSPGQASRQPPAASGNVSSSPSVESNAPTPSIENSATEPTHSFEVIKQEATDALWLALIGAEPFTDIDSELPVYLAEYLPSMFTIVDLNADGIIEIIAEMETELSPNRAVLYYRDGIVYGAVEDIAYINNIFTDGTIEYFDGENFNYYRMDFTDDNNNPISINPVSSDVSNLEGVQWYDYSDDIFDAALKYVNDGHTVLSSDSEAVIDPHRSDYIRAQQLVIDGYYEEAIEIFKTMPGYKDADQMVSGLGCATYANSIIARVTAQYASMSLVGMEVSCEYSPADYTFTMLWEIPEDGIFGALSGILSSAAGETVTYDEDGMRQIAQDIYENYFLPEGYTGVTCAVEMRDYANDIYMIGTYSAE